jgi:predicted dehydrogenase
VGDQFAITRRHDDYRALLDDPVVEAVAVCVPAALHVEVALAALDAEKHLFIEKPLALSLDDSDRLIERAQRSARKILVGFNMRWHRLVRGAREIIRSGDLGALDVARTVWTTGIRNAPQWRSRRELGGGVLWEIAVHHFDLWRFLLQSEVEEVFVTSRSGLWDDDSAVVAARMSSGVVASSAFAQHVGDSHELEIHGKAGQLRVSCYRFDGLEFLPASRHAGDLGIRLKRAVRLVREVPRIASAVRRGGDYVASYSAEWRHFIDAIRHGFPVECTLEDGRRALQVVLAAVASASTGQPVKVAQAPRTMTAVLPLDNTGIKHPTRLEAGSLTVDRQRAPLIDPTP